MTDGAHGNDGPLILRGRFVVTDPGLLPQGGMIEDGFVRIEHGAVTETGRWKSGRHSGDRVVGSDRHIVLPGLVNAHHHGRGLSAPQLAVPDGALEAWLMDYLGMPPLDVHLDTLHSSLRLLRGGTTTVMHSAYVRRPGCLEEETAAALRAYARSGQRVCYALGFEDRLQASYGEDERFAETLPPRLRDILRQFFAPGAAADVETYFALADTTAGRLADDPLRRLALGPTWYNWCSEPFLRRAGEIAARHGCGLHLHAMESPLEREGLRRQFGTDLSGLLGRTGILGPRLSIAHGTHLSEPEIAALAAANATVCVNPGCNLRLRNGVAPFGRMLDAGLTLALGTDSWSLGNRDDLFEEARLMLALQNLETDDRFRPARLTAFDALRMITINAGRATGFGEGLGRLTEAGVADAILIDFDRLAGPWRDPSTHPVETVIAMARAADVETVIVGGLVRKAGDEIPGIDEDAIGRELADIARREAAETGTMRADLAELGRHLAAFLNSAG